MSEKRFEVGFDEKRIFDIYAVNKNTTEYDIHKSCDLINSLYEENEQLKEEIKRLEKIIWKIQWRFQQEVGIEKAKEHYQEIDKEMKE